MRLVGRQSQTEEISVLGNRRCFGRQSQLHRSLEGNLRSEWEANLSLHWRAISVGQMMAEMPKAQGTKNQLMGPGVIGGVPDTPPIPTGPSL